jgi:ABC-type transport system involved in multi-copper enzyme maturation permease subunit
MNWLAWRQHRKQFMVAGIFLVIFAALMIPTGLSFWHTYQHALSTCGKTDTCSQLGGELFQSSIDNLLFHLVPAAIVFVPILLGLFWGVPLLAREYNDGTNKLVWTQSVSRRKWLSVKLVWVIVGAAIVAAGFVALDTWWSKTNNALNLNRFLPLQFSSSGVILVSYAVFAVSLGAAIGAWLKRTMVALGVTLVILIALMLIIVPNFVRPYYETPKSFNMSLTGNTKINGIPTGSTASLTNNASLIVSQTTVSSQNQPLDWANPPKQCIVTSPPGFGAIPSGHSKAVAAPGPNGGEALASQNGGPTVNLNCLQTLGYQMEIKYQPSYRYWDFQRIETGLYLALSIIPIGATYWLVLRRDA